MLGMNTQPKRLYLIRHAESAHNAYALTNPGVDPYLWDAPITEELGREQIAQLRPQVEGLEVYAFVVSPMIRAIQTLLGSFEQRAAAGSIPVIVHHYCRENLTNACDIGTPLSLLRKQTPYHFDFSSMPGEIWWYVPPHLEDKMGVDNYQELFREQRWREPVEVLKKRAQDFKEWVVTLPYQNIAVVSHSGFLMELQGITEKMPNCSLQVMEL